MSVTERVPITAANLRQAAIDAGGSIPSSDVKNHEGPAAETPAPARGLIVDSASVIRRGSLTAFGQEVNGANQSKRMLLLLWESTRGGGHGEMIHFSS